MNSKERHKLMEIQTLLYAGDTKEAYKGITEMLSKRDDKIINKIDTKKKERKKEYQVMYNSLFISTEGDTQLFKEVTPEELENQGIILNIYGVKIK